MVDHPLVVDHLELKHSEISTDDLFNLYLSLLGSHDLSVNDQYEFVS